MSPEVDLYWRFAGYLISVIGGVSTWRVRLVAREAQMRETGTSRSYEGRRGAKILRQSRDEVCSTVRLEACSEAIAKRDEEPTAARTRA